MAIDELFKQITDKFRSADIPTARLDAEVLIAEVLQKDRSWLHAHPEHILKSSQLRKLNAMTGRRIKHEPIAYIVGKQEFYGREFIVSPDTLTPRPETETMLELFMKQFSHESPVTSHEKLQILDVGTGSGCIIISLALELSSRLKTRDLRLLGLDISKKALKVARKNSKEMKADVEFKHFDLMKDNLSSILNPQSPIYILANLPYVPADFKINLAASHEPAFAIYGGLDGLDYYRALFLQISTQNCYVFTESLPPQHSELEKIAKNAGFRLTQEKDFIQVFERVRRTE